MKPLCEASELRDKMGRDVWEWGAVNSSDAPKRQNDEIRALRLSVDLLHLHQWIATGQPKGSKNEIETNDDNDGYNGVSVFAPG